MIRIIYRGTKKTKKQKDFLHFLILVYVPVSKNGQFSNGMCITQNSHQIEMNYSNDKDHLSRNKKNKKTKRFSSLFDISVCSGFQKWTVFKWNVYNTK